MTIENTNINPGIIEKQYDLIKDEPIDGVLHFNLVKEDWCEKLINLAEHKNNTTRHKWTRDRHETYPTQDILIRDIDAELDQSYTNMLEEYIKPMIVEHFGLEGKQVEEGWWYETFIAKYSADTQPKLDLHHDQAAFATVLTLNEEFKGGGTYFWRQKELVKGLTGEMTIHPGMITHKHGARPVTDGTRYILVTFMNFHDAYKEEEK